MTRGAQEKADGRPGTVARATGRGSADGCQGNEKAPSYASAPAGGRKAVWWAEGRGDRVDWAESWQVSQ